MQKITPFLWYHEKAEEAAAFYASVFPDSRVTRVGTLESESPSGPSGSVKVVEFTLCGQALKAMTAPGPDSFNHAISMVVNCESQDEVDKYWDALLAGGGNTEACGWLKDRYGVSWQIVPVAMFDMLAASDRAASKRASDAMLKMIKLDLPALEAAFRGK